VSGPPAKLAEVAALLHDRPGVAHVTAFGNTLHVTGEDPDALARAVSAFPEKELQWKKAQPGLEDVFIGLMENAEDNFA